jgi:hypothetical protein
MTYPDMLPVFLLTEQPLRRRWLRRLSAGLAKCDICERGYHQAKNLIGDFANDLRKHSNGGKVYPDPPPRSAYELDPRWPMRAACGYIFEATDNWQVFERALYSTPTGELITLDEAAIGACWDAWWYKRKGPDGRALVVKCPDGYEWAVDQRCRACTLPTESHHHCWVRHGSPEDGSLHIDKDGLTCGAGAGSIMTGKWHGYLDHGLLRLERALV